ncbi:MAG: hypothetical protein ACK4WC_11845, partial [Rubrimonas sp.]
MLRTIAAGIATAVISFGVAQANTIIVTPDSPLFGIEASGGGSAAITADAPRAGDGSVRLTGDRVRMFLLGNPYSPASNLGLLSELTAFGFDWSIDPASTNPYNPDYTPALRLHIWDGAQRSELIWEGAYNGVYGNVTAGEWYAADMFGPDAGRMWRFESGVGETLVGGALGLFTVENWVTSGLFSANAYIAAISIGVGGGASGDYLAYADNIRLAFGGDVTTYNFETGADTPVPVPGPAALPLLATGLGLMALVRRRRAAA